MTAARSEAVGAGEDATSSRPVRIGISSCLLGEAVRFDGGHKRDTFLTDTLSRFVEWVPVCPEVESGMGTPREPMRLVRMAGDDVRLVTVKTGVDLTEQLAGHTRRRVTELSAEDLSGYVLKKDSPSCGLERVRVFDRDGAPDTPGTGVFAAALAEHFPLLPMEEEGRLSDPQLRDNFVERVFAYHRLRTLFGRRWTVGDLVRFHTVHKLILMAHVPEAYRQLGRLVSAAAATPRDELKRRYSQGFMGALKIVTTPGRHVNVLQHAAGYFKRQLDAESRGELAAAIEAYRDGRVPLGVPLTLLRHHVRQHNVEYLAAQLYLADIPESV